jgi:hypothetical protein
VAHPDVVSKHGAMGVDMEGGGVYIAHFPEVLVSICDKDLGARCD